MKYSNNDRNNYQKQACYDSYICKSCGSMVVPEWAIIHRCSRCGHLSSNRIAADDNPVKLISIALQPLARPPFPLHEIGTILQKNLDPCFEGEAENVL